MISVVGSRGKDLLYPPPLPSLHFYYTLFILYYSVHFLFSAFQRTTGAWLLPSWMLHLVKDSINNVLALFLPVTSAKGAAEVMMDTF